MMKQTNTRAFALELRKAFASKDSYYQYCMEELFLWQLPRGKARGTTELVFSVPA